MIKLKVPLNYNGVIHAKGTRINLDDDFEEVLINNGKAEKFPKQANTEEIENNNSEEIENA